MSNAWIYRTPHDLSSVDNTNSKVRHFDFFDQHIKNYDVETSALHRKLQSKTEALRILRKELEQFRTERDQFKLMAETLQLRYSAIKRSNDCNNFGFGAKSSVANLLHDTRERNIKLTTEVESLKQKLDELQGDIELLRSKNCSAKSKAAERSSQEANDAAKETQLWKEERADFICHLESLKKKVRHLKNAQLAFDLKVIIDEKEEIITERDAYKCKAHRLNHELFIALKANANHPKLLDIDSIILENKYLHECLKNYENELELTKQSSSKYKSMLDAKRKKGIVKLGAITNEETILTHKQVKTILESGVDLPNRTETITDLKSLCLNLLDNLNDKTLALNHQKKTNKTLATKIAELEHRIQVLAGTDLSGLCSNDGFSPSQILLHGYCSALVDSSSNDTNDTLTSTNAAATSPCVRSGAAADRKSGDSEDFSSGKTEYKKHSHISDDGLSSLSSESSRSIQSSEYGFHMGPPYNLSEFTNSTLYAYKTSSTTDSGNGGGKKHNALVNTLLPSSVVKERIEDLKDLPPDLAAMVQQALHELDMRDFDEILTENEDIVTKVLTHASDTPPIIAAEETDAENQK